MREIGQPGDLGWVVLAHGEVYADEFGWDTSFESLVAGIVARFDPATDRGWIAVDDDGRRVGCVFAVHEDDEAMRLRLLLVHPDGRGHALGGRLVDECLAAARQAGYRRMVLWTNDPLTAARHLYLQRGFVLTAEEPHTSFGHDLVGQTYVLDL